MWFSNPIPAVSVTEASEKVRAEGATFIDVRTPEEYRSGHAAGARNVPLGDLNDPVAEQLKRFSEVYVICQSGGRSSTAVAKLRAANVNAINVKGGTSAWRSSNLAIA